jgi:hypothetical protein
MAGYQTSMFVPRPIEGVFEFVSDFRNARTWDPLVTEASRIGSGPIERGASFQLVTVLGPLRLVQPYEVVEHLAPHQIHLRGETWLTRYEDRISFATVTGGTRVDYAAELDLRGWIGLPEPLMARLLARIGDRATARMPAAIERGVPA